MTRCCRNGSSFYGGFDVHWDFIAMNAALNLTTAAVLHEGASKTFQNHLSNLKVMTNIFLVEYSFKKALKNNEGWIFLHSFEFHYNIIALGYTNIFSTKASVHNWYEPFSDLRLDLLQESFLFEKAPIKSIPDSLLGRIAACLDWMIH